MSPRPSHLPRSPVGLFPSPPLSPDPVPTPPHSIVSPSLLSQLACVRNMFTSIVGLGHNIDIRGPCAPGPYHPGPIDCVSLNSFQIVRPFQQKKGSSYVVLASVSKQNLEVCGVSCLGHLENVDMLSSIHWPGPQFSTCVVLARLAHITPVPIACVSLNKLLNLRPSQ